MLDSELEKNLNEAFKLAHRKKHEFVTVEHLFLSILENNDALEVLNYCGADIEALQKNLESYIKETTPLISEEDEQEIQSTLGFQRVLQRAVFHVQSSGKKEVNGANLLVAIFSEKESHSVYLLQQEGITRLDIVSFISHGKNDEELEDQIVEDLDIEESTEPETIIEDAIEDNTTSNDSESSDLDEIQEIEITNDNESELSVDVSSENETNNKNESVDSSTINDRSPSSKIIDERAIFKNKSSSESGSKGSSLEMQGWVWDFEPNPIDNSRESGKIIFEIIVDYYGEIIGLKTLETTLSPAIEDIYREEILKLTFSPTNNDNPAEVSKGKITFIIKNN